MDRITVEDLEIPEATVFLTKISGNSPVDKLIEDTPWRKRTSIIYGRRVSQPRLTAWYGDEGCDYQYSGVDNAPLPWTPLIARLRKTVEEIIQYEFNSCLLNYYRDGQDSIGFHSDDEKELGLTPVIASLSFGSPRDFVFRNRRAEYGDIAITLEDRSLLFMMGDTQKNWKHGILKCSEKKPRINLTFRKIV